MAQVLVRNVDEAIVVALKQRARANGRSLEAELRLMLEAAAREPDDPVRAALRGVPGIRIPKTTAREPFKPVRLRGTPASERLVADRRRGR